MAAAVGVHQPLGRDNVPTADGNRVAVRSSRVSRYHQPHGDERVELPDRIPEVTVVAHHHSGVHPPLQDVEQQVGDDVDVRALVLPPRRRP
jgi:hypothetical protein